MTKDFNNSSAKEQREEKPAGDHDSLFGTLLFESFCGGALSEVMAEAMDVPEWTRELDVDSAVDMVDEYWRDRTNGGFKLGVKNEVLSGAFNSLGLTCFPKNDGIIEREPASPPHPAYQTAVYGQGSYAPAIN